MQNQTTRKVILQNMDIGIFLNTTTVVNSTMDDTELTHRIRIVVSIYGALLIIAGSIGNFGLAFIILRDKRRLKATTRILFTLLAAMDTLVLWIAVLRYWVRVTFKFDLRTQFPALCPIHVFAVYVSTNMSSVIFCILCVDRCIVICTSLKCIQSNLPKIPLSSYADSTLQRIDMQNNSLLTDTSLRCYNDYSMDPVSNYKRVIQKHSQFKRFIYQLGVKYSRKPEKWILISFIIGILIVLAKHVPVFNDVKVLSNGAVCNSGWPGHIRDYIDFFTQAILSFLFIIPSNVIVYRAIAKHQRTIDKMQLYKSKGKQFYGSSARIPIQASYKVPNSSYSLRLNQNHAHMLQSNRGNCGRSTSSFVTAATQLSNGHLFIFKTLITLSVFNFVINFPGYLYAQVIQPMISQYWSTETPLGNLTYDILFIIAFSNNGASFYVLLCTVQGFRRRVTQNLKKFKFCKRNCCGPVSACCCQCKSSTQTFSSRISNSRESGQNVSNSNNTWQRNSILHNSKDENHFNWCANHLSIHSL